MKNFQFLFLFFLVISLTACSTMNKTSGLVGKWRLTETLADPGDGKGSWNPAPSESFLTFNTDGSVNSTEFPSYKSYLLRDSDKVEFTLADGRKQIVTYRMEGTALVLSPQCIEACGSKYIRAN